MLLESFTVWLMGVLFVFAILAKNEELSKSIFVWTNAFLFAALWPVWGPLLIVMLIMERFGG